MTARPMPDRVKITEWQGLPPAATPDAGDATAPSSIDIYFSADVETDGPIPGPYSLLSFALVVAGCQTGTTFRRASKPEASFYRELRPISETFDPEALQVNLLDRDKLLRDGADPADAMTEAAEWVRRQCGTSRPILVAFPLSFDWTWLYWYFVRFSRSGSPFGHSSCFDIKTAFAVKSKRTISEASRSKLPESLRSESPHTHNALDDAREQAEVFARIMEW